MTSTARLSQITPAGRTLTFDLDPEQVTASSGVGGWEEVPHPYRPSTTRWTSLPLRQLTVALMLDGWRQQRSVEEECRILEAYARPQANTNTPPVLAFLWGSYAPLRWVINDLSWGDELRDPAGRRLRQQVTLSLLEHREDALSVADPRKAAPAPAKGTPRPSTAAPVASGRTYTVKRGDTLSVIASRELGRSSRWPEVAKLNNLRDPDRLTVGQRLRLPAR